jgi:hypothetical protein
MTGLRGPLSLTTAIVLVLGVWLSGQTPQVFQFVVSVTNADGMPVAGLGPDDVVMSENGVKTDGRQSGAGAIPMKLTIAVDNGLESSDAIAHYRAWAEGARRGPAARRRSHPDYHIASAAHRRQTHHRPRADSPWHQQV